jgi:hypothetical protein
VIQPAGSGPPAGAVALVLSGTWPAGWSYSVLKDGTALAAGAYQLQANAFILFCQPADAAHTYVIAPAVSVTRNWLPAVQR